MLIESSSNAKFKAWSSLLESRGIKKSGRALLSGRKIIEEFLAQSPDRAEDLLLPPKAEEPAVPSHVRLHRLSSPLFNELDVLGTKSPLLIVQTRELPEWKMEPPQGLELIVALSDPSNLGALVRSAEAFGVKRVILTEEAASPYLPKSTRASSGASLRMNLVTTGKLAEVQIDAYSLDMQGADIATFAWPKDLYLILGEEGRGVPKNFRPLCIPMQGPTESLNATTAAAIAMFSYRIAQR